MDTGKEALSNARTMWFSMFIGLAIYPFVAVVIAENYPEVIGKWPIGSPYVIRIVIFIFSFVLSATYEKMIPGFSLFVHERKKTGNADKSPLPGFIFIMSLVEIIVLAGFGLFICNAKTADALIFLIPAYYILYQLKPDEEKWEKYQKNLNS